MWNKWLWRAGMALLPLCAALPAMADSQFRVRQMTRGDVPAGQGQCDIRLIVDHEVEVSLRRDVVSVRTLGGLEPRDNGSECNAPLPDGVPPQNFNFRVTESRDQMRMLSQPSPRNGFATVVQISDASVGEGRYAFRVTWRLSAADMGRMEPPPGQRVVPGTPPGMRGPAGFAWNNVVHYNGTGRGSSTLTAYGSQRLTDVTVDIDRAGKTVVSFRGETERPLAFTGTVTAREGQRYRVDAVTEDRRLHGSMYITVGPRDEVSAVEFDGTDGWARLRLTWAGR